MKLGTTARWALVAAACWVGGCDRGDGSAIGAEPRASATASVPAPASAGASAAAPQASEAASGAPLSSGAPEASAARSAQALASPAGSSGPDAARSESVKVLEPGKEPRQELRLAAKVGQAETMRMKMIMDVGVQMGTQKLPKTDVPPMIMTMDMKVTETKPNGDIGYDFSLVKTEVGAAAALDPKVVKAVEAALAKINGLSGHASVSNRGFNRGAKMNAPPQADAQTKQVLESMEQAMNQVGAPLPAEPVGLGAKWQSELALVQGGIHLSQVSTYTLERLEGSKLGLKVELQQSAPRQKLTPQPGTTVEILSLGSKGGGSSQVDLLRLAPVQSLLELQSDVTMALPQGQNMAMTTKLRIEIGSK
jgi:hypothetical protein